MPITVTITVNHEDLDRLIAAAPVIDADICDLISQDIQFGAKARAAVDTGAMRDSIERALSGGWFSVISLAEYSSFVEFGTTKMAAQPFMQPALEAADIQGECEEAMRMAGF